MVNCRNSSLSSFTCKLASLSSGDHGGRSPRLVLFSARRNDFVTCLSISLSAYRSVALSILLGCSAASRWDILYCFQ